MVQQILLIVTVQETGVGGTEVGLLELIRGQADLVDEHSLLLQHPLPGDGRVVGGD